MLYTSSLLAHTERNVKDSSLSAAALARSAYTLQVSSGVYSYLTLGKRVLDRITAVVRSEMDSLAQEVLLPTLQSRSLWEESGRFEVYGAEMLRLTDRKGAEHCLGPTAEEVACLVAKSQVSSYRALPLALYQVNTKYRDELRPRNGLVRSREFLMKDAYSFHLTEESLLETYEAFSASYERIFARLGLTCLAVSADAGEIGGKASREFLALSTEGEDTVCACGRGTSLHEGCSLLAAVEVGHVFQLHDRYSAAMDFALTDAAGQRRNVLMGCYGIGISRLLAVLAAEAADEKGFAWSRLLAPADVHVLAVRRDLSADARRLASSLEERGFRVILEDRDVRAGAALAEADLLGASHVLTLGRDFSEGLVEVKDRLSGERTLLKEEQLLAHLLA